MLVDDGPEASEDESFMPSIQTKTQKKNKQGLAPSKSRVIKKKLASGMVWSKSSKRRTEAISLPKVSENLSSNPGLNPELTELENQMETMDDSEIDRYLHQNISSPLNSQKSPQASPSYSQKSSFTSPSNSHKSPPLSPSSSQKSPPVSISDSQKSPPANPWASSAASPWASFDTSLGEYIVPVSDRAHGSKFVVPVGDRAHGSRFVVPEKDRAQGSRFVFPESGDGSSSSRTKSRLQKHKKSKLFID